jgi:hypothetical protein
VIFAGVHGQRARGAVQTAVTWRSHLLLSNEGKTHGHVRGAIWRAPRGCIKPSRLQLGDLPRQPRIHARIWLGRSLGRTMRSRTGMQAYQPRR